MCTVPWCLHNLNTNEKTHNFVPMLFGLYSRRICRSNMILQSISVCVWQHDIFLCFFSFFYWVYLGRRFLGFFPNFEKLCQVQNNSSKWKLKGKCTLSSCNLAWENNHKFSHKSFLCKIWLRFTFSSIQPSVDKRSKLIE